MSLDLTQNIRHHGFKRLLLAVSGGLDSICLAHYFTENREALGIEWLGIAHVHHGLREKTADRDAEFVEEFARKYNVPFFLKKLDGEALKNADGSLEENARDARYKALVEIALDPIASARLQDDTPHTSHPTSHTPHLKAAEGCDLTPHPSFVIVTAHHAGDQAETLLMRLRRGTTLAGLRGIQENRILSTPYPKAAEGCDLTHHTPYLYRPFLNITRTELLAYAKENRLTWCEDESNADVKFVRNQLRHEMLPLLERECRGATTQLGRIAPLADRAYKKVIAKCEELFQTSLPKESEANDLASQALSFISLDKKKLNKVLREHAGADLSEMFRLWLSEQGFRFPVGFFYGEKEPAHVKIPHRSAYRKRSIYKMGSTVLICEFEDVASALKFVSCEKKV